MTNEQKVREIRETAETLIEDRGGANALAWAEHCMTRDPAGGFWRAVWVEIGRQCAETIFAKARAARAAREATRVNGRLP